MDALRQYEQPFCQEDVRAEQLNLYASVPPWEYMMHHSNLALHHPQSAEGKLSDRQNLELKSTQQLKCLVDSFEKMLNEFKSFVNATCCTTPKESSEDPGKTALEEGCIVLSETLSILLGLDIKKFSPKVCIVDPVRVQSEYQRCLLVVDAVVQMLCYKETDESATNMMMMDVEMPPMIKTEDIGMTNEYCVLDEDSSSISLYSTTSSQIDKGDDFLQIEQEDFTGPCHIENRNKTLQLIQKMEKHTTKGYNTKFCITEEMYNETISKGNPYICICERQFQSRHLFEYHLKGNRCLGIEGEKRRKELQPQFKKSNESGKLQCLNQDNCQDKVFDSIFWLHQHHQNEHLKDVKDCPYKCDNCNEKFFSRLLLCRHRQNVHGEVVRKEVCKHCRRHFKSKGKLRLHMEQCCSIKNRAQLQIENNAFQQSFEEEQNLGNSGIPDASQVLCKNNEVTKKKLKRKRIKPRVMLEPAKVQAANIPERYPCGKKRYRPVGYYPEYSIRKEQSLEIRSKGKPYVCACQKQFVQDTPLKDTYMATALGHQERIRKKNCMQNGKGMTMGCSIVCFLVALKHLSTISAYTLITRKSTWRGLIVHTNVHNVTGHFF